MDSRVEKFIELIKQSKRMTVFTGAGVSTMSGIPDFRGPHGVYSDPWHGMDVEDIISIDFFRKDPKTFYAWAKDVWYRLENYEPNVVHRMCALLEKKGYIKGVFTQNIDMLHQKAGSAHVRELHGSPEVSHCTKCGATFPYKDIAPVVLKDEVPKCPKCGGVIKPDIVFYGEALNGRILDLAQEEFSHTDLCLVMGSSLTVQPAASLPLIASYSGGKVVIINAQPTAQDGNAVLKFDDLEEVCAPVAEWLEK